MLPKKGWLGGRLWKPTNPHSLEHLKYLYNVLCKNQNVTEQNRAQLVETLRSISEILIWGDQNDSTVFDFFLEKNMLSFFLQFMKQKSGRFIIVQLLQTLNILFENISNQTSIYYLLSNNHVNSIIVHKFDFSDEEVMAYYISFLKTLSLRLNKHTVHFFYNEQTNDFPLYTEAIKFFNHSETMVRIAVRTITLNVYRVEDKSMLWYIRDKTASPYFSNLVWFIGNHVLDLDACVRHDIDHNSRDRLADLVAEHLDHLHYLNDILLLRIDSLNQVLTEHLLNNLLLPLYVYSMWRPPRSLKYQADGRPRVSQVVALFLLSQVFLIMHHPPLVRHLVEVIFNANLSFFFDESLPATESQLEAEPETSQQQRRSVYQFSKPSESLAKTLEKNRGGGKPSKRPNYRNSPVDEGAYGGFGEEEEEDNEPQDKDERKSRSIFYRTLSDTGETTATDSNQTNPGDGEGETAASAVEPEYSGQVAAGEEREGQQIEAAQEAVTNEEAPPTDDVSVSRTADSAAASDTETLGSEDTLSEAGVIDIAPITANVTDDEKLAWGTGSDADGAMFTLKNRPFLEAVFNSLEPKKDDYKLLLSLCLLYAISHNQGINQELLDTIQLTTDKSTTKVHYNVTLVEQLIKVITSSCQSNSKVRLASLDLSIKLLKSLVYTPDRCDLQDGHLAAVEGCREEATLMLRNFYKVWEKSEEIFLDMFEDEFREMKNRPLNVEFMMMDASVLLPPTGTPLTGIDFMKRLPCGEVERARKAIRVLFYLRDLSLTLREETEDQLPLTKEDECIKVNDVLDLNNSDLIGCTVLYKDNKRERRFLVIDILQLILVEPDNRKLGWGIVKFVGLLQDVEVSGDKDDSRCLHVTIHRPSVSAHVRPTPLLAAKFMFDDHIRCMAAKQRLSKGRLRARQRKMQMIARLLELPSHIVDAIYQPLPSPSTPAPAKIQGAGPSGSGTPSGAAIPGRSRQVTSEGKPRPKSALHPLLRHTSLNVPGQQQQQAETSVKKSVFSSIDRSKAFSVAEAQTKEEERKRTPRAIKERIAKRRSALVKQSKTGDGAGQVVDTAAGEVEQAVEAEDASATQVFREAAAARGNKTDPENSGETHIALDDLSKKLNRLVTDTRELFKGSRTREELAETSQNETSQLEENSDLDTSAEDTSFMNSPQRPPAESTVATTADVCSSPEMGCSPRLGRKAATPLTLTPAPAPTVSLVSSYLPPVGDSLVAVSTATDTTVSHGNQEAVEASSANFENTEDGAAHRPEDLPGLVRDSLGQVDDSSGHVDGSYTQRKLDLSENSADTDGSSSEQALHQSSTSASTAETPSSESFQPATTDTYHLGKQSSSTGTTRTEPITVAGRSAGCEDMSPPFLSYSKTPPSMEPSSMIANPEDFLNMQREDA